MAQRKIGRIIDGELVAAAIREGLKDELADLARKGLTPGLAVILVGEDPASQVYVGRKKKACLELGIRSFEHLLPADVTEKKLLGVIEKLNQDARVHGILLQLPLPRHIDESKMLIAIDPAKDVDGFHPINAGRLLTGQDGFAPCTPLGCVELLLHYKFETAGRRAVIVGRSNIVGKPLAALMMRKGPGGNATVTVCHSQTRNIGAITREADILIAAIGQPKFITSRMVRAGAIVIDVGVNRVPDATRKSGYRLVGDVDFERVRGKARAITPVPGGVGPMTITMLLKNTVKAARVAFGLTKAGAKK